jgi:5-methylcytosine-specific restriction endonuclease McrA
MTEQKWVEEARKHIGQKEVAGVESKICTKCGESKGMALFPAQKRNRDGKDSRCNACANLNAKTYAVLNRDKIREKKAVYRAANADKLNFSKAAWCAANADKITAYSKSYYTANADRIKASQSVYRYANASKVRVLNAAYRKANPTTVRLAHQNRRARKSGAGGKLSHGLAVKLFKLQRGKCVCGCAQPLGKNYHLDHIMPLFLGGSNMDDNIQLLRSTCNLQKGFAHPADFMRSRGFLI